MSHVCAFLRAAACAETDVAWMADEASTCTRGTFHRRVTQLAFSLRSVFALPVGSRVAFLASTTIRFLEALLASLCNGWIVVLLNTRWGQTEARAALLSVQPELLLFDQDASNVALALVKGTKMRPLLIGERKEPIQDVPCTEELSVTMDSAEVELRIAVDGGAVICFTSGSTGKPKGVLLSHQALCFQCLYKIALCSYSSEDTYLHTAPLFHIGGLVSALAMLRVDARHVLTKKFNSKQASHLIQHHSITAMIVVPAMITDLASVNTISFPSIKKLLIGGGTPNCQQVRHLRVFYPPMQLCPGAFYRNAVSECTYLDGLWNDRGELFPDLRGSLHTSSTPTRNSRPRPCHSWHLHRHRLHQ